MVNYGGDEVSAIVIDIGYSSVRAGYAGDDHPKSVIPSCYGYRNNPTAPEGDAPMNVTEDATAATNNGGHSKYAQLYIGQQGPSVWRAGMEVGNPIRDGLIYDFNPIPSLISHALVNEMQCNPAEHPVLVTEPAWNTAANRERMAEILFEEFHVPAFYVANTGVLNTFAAGKGSAMVIDIGASMASAIPVVDGFVLRKGLAYSSLPQFVHAHCKHILAASTPTRRGAELFPHQLIANKTAVEPHTPPRYTLRQDRYAATTQSWLSWAESREVEEWIHSVASVLDQGWNDQVAISKPQRQYEFATGYNAFYGHERFTVGEQLFNHSPALLATNPNLPKTIPQLIGESLRACEPDLRQVLIGNVVLTGGGSFLTGFADRLNNELARNFNHVKIHAPGNTVERRFASWLGGSILASLGTFHQLWISQEEWQEHGKAIVGQRCK